MLRGLLRVPRLLPRSQSPNLHFSAAAVRSMSSYRRLVRFTPPSGDQVLIGEPADPEQDVGLASYAGEPIEVEVFGGKSILSPGERSGRREKVGKLLSPIAKSEVGTIRCIGLNVSAVSSPPFVALRLLRLRLTPTRPFGPTTQYRNHAEEANLPIPDVPVLFMKPSTALSDPFPAPTVLPKSFAKDDSADYESELAVIIGKDCKNVSEAEAMNYVLG